jgi:hypothetical protein
MKPINTLPIEEYLNKARIAVKSNQKTLNLDIKEAQALADSLAIVMTRLLGDLDNAVNIGKPAEDSLQIKMDGGSF